MSREGEDIEKWLEKVHPQFLDAIKDAQPLALLASLCLVIAAFSYDEFTNAQGYAIGAAFAFLYAFLVSVCFKIISTPSLALFSYVFTAVGMILLYLVIQAYSSINPFVGSVIDLSSRIGLSIFGGLFPLYYIIIRARRDLENKIADRTVLIKHALPCVGFSLILVSSSFSIYYGFYRIKIPELMNTLVYLGIALALIGYFPIIHEQRKARKSKIRK
jgi:hypothetical protein